MDIRIRLSWRRSRRCWDCCCFSAASFYSQLFFPSVILDDPCPNSKTKSDDGLKRSVSTVRAGVVGKFVWLFDGPIMTELRVEIDWTLWLEDAMLLELECLRLMKRYSCSLYPTGIRLLLSAPLRLLRKDGRSDVSDVDIVKTDNWYSNQNFFRTCELHKTLEREREWERHKDIFFDYSTNLLFTQKSGRLYYYATDERFIRISRYSRETAWLRWQLFLSSFYTAQRQDRWGRNVEKCHSRLGIQSIDPLPTGKGRKHWSISLAQHSALLSPIRCSTGLPPQLYHLKC
jgi:hypothetical protein